MLEGEELTELEKFFDKFPVGCEYDEEMDVIVAWLDKIRDGKLLLVDKEIAGDLQFI